MWRMFMSSSMKAAIYLAPKDRELGSFQQHEHRGNSEFVQYHTEIGIGTIECELQLTVLLPHGRDRHCLMTNWSSGQKQKYVSIQILSCVWWKCHFTTKQSQDEKVKWKNSRCPFLVENCWESMEKQFQDLRHYRFFKKSRMICKSGTWNLKHSQIGSSLCQCSKILIGQEKETMRFRIQKKSRRTRKNCRRDTGRSSVLETKRSGMENQSTFRRKVEFRSFKDGTAIQGHRSPSLYKCQCIESWNSVNPDRKRNHTLQCGCFKLRTLVPNHSFCNSAQYFRSSFELVLAIRFKNGQEGTRKNSRNWRIREQRNTKEREFKRSELVFSKTSIWKQIAVKHPDLPITFRDHSIHKGLRTRIVRVPGIGWYELQTRPDEDDGSGDPSQYAETTHFLEQTHNP